MKWGCDAVAGIRREGTAARVRSISVLDLWLLEALQGLIAPSSDLARLVSAGPATVGTIACWAVCPRPLQRLLHRRLQPTGGALGTGSIIFLLRLFSQSHRLPSNRTPFLVTPYPRRRFERPTQRIPFSCDHDHGLDIACRLFSPANVSSSSGLPCPDRPLQCHPLLLGQDTGLSPSQCPHSCQARARLTIAFRH